MSLDSLSQIRKIRVFIPPPDSPLLTTYNRSLLPKLHPLKQQHQILSKRTQSPGKQSSNPQTLLIKSSQVDIINNLYRKIKRSRGETVHEKETSYVKDPLYKSIYNLKLETIKMKMKMGEDGQRGAEKGAAKGRRSRRGWNLSMFQREEEDKLELNVDANFKKNQRYLQQKNQSRNPQFHKGMLDRISTDTKKALSITTKSTIGYSGTMTGIPMPLTNMDRHVRMDTIANQGKGIGVSTNERKYFDYQGQRRVICRVCLEESHPFSLVTQPYIRPCGCKGLLEFCHQSCLLQWANQLITKRLQLGEPTQKIYCQQCKEQLHIKMAKTFRCRSRSQRKKTIQVYWPYLVLYITAIVLSLGIMGMLGYFQSTLNRYDSIQKPGFIMLYTTGWVLMSLSTIIWIVKIIKAFFVVRVSRAVGVEATNPTGVGAEVRGSCSNNSEMNNPMYTNTNMNMLGSQNTKILNINQSININSSRDVYGNIIATQPTPISAPSIATPYIQPKPQTTDNPIPDNPQSQVHLVKANNMETDACRGAKDYIKEDAAYGSNFYADQQARIDQVVMRNSSAGYFVHPQLEVYQYGSDSNNSGGKGAYGNESGNNPRILQPKKYFF